ncbi:MAG: CHAT domain-containing protein [Thermoanaerobaculia bacterium]|nr:CHAT domain-containing protein [Thermoanaerobaculia bacterium]
MLIALFLAATAAAQASRPLELRLTVNKIEEQLHVDLRLIGWDAGETAPAVFAVPIPSQEQRDLRWYLEESWQWPNEIDAERAAKIEAAMKAWGERLWNGVFSDPQRLRVWQRFVDAEAAGRLVTISSSDPEVLRLPWELLADPEGDYLFSRGISVRRRLPLPLPQPPRDLALPLRILMVVARPEGASFIDPRASSLALLDGVEELGAASVAVEFLHPPTFEALVDRLNDRRLPPVHVVHFDGHGSFDERRDVGSLLFEDSEGKLDAVDAERLGTLVQRVPLWVLDACESADVDTPDPFASVAPRLVKAGAGSVVAMQYSVLVDTTRRFFESFYRELARGGRIGEAMDAGRRKLFADSKRFASSVRPGARRQSDSEPVQPGLALRDWFVPVLYQREADPAPFAGVEPAAASPVAVVDDGFPEPPYRFVGRSRELWELERELRRRRVVVLHGLAGEGKTALASETARWLRRKGLFERAIFVSFEGGGGLDAAVSSMGWLLEGADFAQRPQPEQAPAVLAALAKVPTLVVWDNFESVLPKWEHALRDEDLRDLLEFGEQVSLQGGSRLLVTSRDPQLPHASFQASARAKVYELRELLPAEALELAGLVLDELGLEKRPPRAEMAKLLEFLGGNPLAIQLVVRQLPGFGGDAQAVIRALEKLDPERPAAGVCDRNSSLELSLSFSWQRLSEETRALLGPLGVLQGGVFEFGVPDVLGIEMGKWNGLRDQVIGELVQVGLVRRVLIPYPVRALGEAAKKPAAGKQPEIEPIPFYEFHPTLAPFLSRRLSAEERTLVEQRYRETYFSFSVVLHELDTRMPRETRVLAQRELPNLLRAFELTMKRGRPRLLRSLLPTSIVFSAAWGDGRSSKRCSHG